MWVRCGFLLSTTKPFIACSAVKCEAREVGVTVCALGHCSNARGQLGHLLLWGGWWSQQLSRCLVTKCLCPPGCAVLLCGLHMHQVTETCLMQQLYGGSWLRILLGFLFIALLVPGEGFAL